MPIRQIYDPVKARFKPIAEDVEEEGNGSGDEDEALKLNQSWLSLGADELAAKHLAEEGKDDLDPETGAGGEKAEEEKAGSNARTFARAVKDREVDVEKYSRDLKLKEKLEE